MSQVQTEVKFEFPVFGEEWIPSDIRPTSNTEVLGLWQHWDPDNRLMHCTVQLCEFVEVTPPYSEKTEEDEEEYGWHRTISYKNDPHGLTLKTKKCIAPTFWKEVRYP